MRLPPGQLRSGGSIQGIVAKAGTEAPIEEARVMAFAPTSPMPKTVLTGASGKFVITDLDPGSYRLFVVADGFVRHDLRTPVEVVAGLAVRDVRVSMIPAGNVNGRICDSDGKPLAGVPVQLLKPAYNFRGERTMQSAGAASTDDRGEYRAYWVTPGRYYVLAGSSVSSPRGRMAGRMMGGISPNVPSGYTVPPRYFPNAAELSNATAIEIVSGGDLHGIDFVVDRQPLRRIRGRVVDAAAGGGPAAAKIQLVTRWMTGGTSSRGDHRSYNPADGTFELADVPYGIHEVVVEVTASGTPAPRRTPPLVPAGSGRVGVIYIGVRPRELVTAGARVPVMVGNSDIENMVVTLGAGRALSGRLSIDGPPRGVNGLSVHLTPSSNGRMISYTQGPALATVALDGTFKFEHVLPGEYRVQLDGLEPDST